ncbi:MAG: hypothetical protein ACK553_16750 [Planctomycetota bacterium]|jgi:hypothetical protein
MGERSAILMAIMGIVCFTDPPLRVEFAKPNATAVLSSQESIESSCYESTTEPNTSTTPETITMLEIKSSTGIGECLVHRNHTTWPKRLLLRFALRGLEQVVIHIGDRTWHGAVSSHDGSVRWTRRIGDGPELPLEPTDPDRPRIQVIDKAGERPIQVPLSEDERWEFRLPAGWLSENPESIRIGWIDFYR